MFLKGFHLTDPLHCLQSVSGILHTCHWFEEFAWWRVATKAPCLSDVVLTKSEFEINDTALRNLESEIRSTNGDYCDGRIEDDLSRDAVLLERKKKTYITNPFLVSPEM